MQQFSIKANKGFTLVELITVIVLIGILAVYAVPKFTSDNQYDTSVVRDILISSARQAQQLAMNMGDTVTIGLQAPASPYTAVITSNGVTYKTFPKDPNSFNSTATFTAINISYDRLGNTTAQDITITSGSTSKCMKIESTGYVHDC